MTATSISRRAVIICCRAGHLLGAQMPATLEATAHIQDNGSRSPLLPPSALAIEPTSPDKVRGLTHTLGKARERLASKCGRRTAGRVRRVMVVEVIMEMELS